MTPEERIKIALTLIGEFGTTKGAHHKQWIIDQAVRVVLDCPYRLDACYDENDDYRQWIRQVEDSGYEWWSGIAP